MQLKAHTFSQLAVIIQNESSFATQVDMLILSLIVMVIKFHVVLSLFSNQFSSSKCAQPIGKLRNLVNK